MSFRMKMPARILLGVVFLAPIAWFAWKNVPEQGTVQSAPQPVVEAQPQTVQVQPAPMPQPAPQVQAPAYTPVPQPEAASQTGNAGLNALIQRGKQ